VRKSQTGGIALDANCGAGVSLCQPR